MSKKKEITAHSYSEGEGPLGAQVRCLPVPDRLNMQGQDSGCTAGATDQVQATAKSRNTGDEDRSRLRNPTVNLTRISKVKKKPVITQVLNPDQPSTSALFAKPERQLMVSLRRAFLKKKSTEEMDEPMEQGDSETASNSAASGVTPTVGTTPIRRRRTIEHAEASDDSLSSCSSRTKKPRGRPPTTGDYVNRAEALQKALDAEKKTAQWRKLARYLDGEKQTKAVTTRKKETAFTNRSIEDYRNAPVVDLRPRILENMDHIEGALKVPEKPLHGVLQKRINEAMWGTRAAVSVLAEREEDEETAILQNKIKELEAQIQELKTTLEKKKSPRNSRSPGDPASTSGRGRTSARKPTKRKAVSYSSSRERHISWDTRSGDLTRMEERICGKIMAAIEARFQGALVSESDALQTDEITHSRITDVGEREKAGPYPPQTTLSQGDFKVVKGKKGARKRKKKSLASKEREARQKQPVMSPKRVASKSPKRRAPSKMAAITVTSMDGKYDELFTLARARTKPEDYGITNMRVKRSLIGGYIFEIAGEQGAEQANKFAAGLQTALKDTQARVSRPVRKMELRLKRIMDSIKPNEVVNAIVEKCGCDPSQIESGLMRRTPDGLGVMWVRLPYDAGVMLVKDGRFRVGWSNVTVVQLEQRKLQCFRCLEYGHVRAKCNNIDRSDMCYRCGERGHVVRNCDRKPHCVVCEIRGLSAGHRAGGEACPPYSKREIKMSAGGWRGPGAARKTGGQVPARHPGHPTKLLEKEKDPGTYLNVDPPSGTPQVLEPMVQLDEEIPPSPWTEGPSSVPWLDEKTTSEPGPLEVDVPETEERPLMGMLSDEVSMSSANKRKRSSSPSKDTDAVATDSQVTRVETSTDASTRVDVKEEPGKRLCPGDQLVEESSEDSEIAQVDG